jgi:hypothetical protein
MDTSPQPLDRREQIALTLFRLAGGPEASAAADLPAEVAHLWLSAADQVLALEEAASQNADEERDQARRSRQFAESWYGERFERLRAYAREHGFWHDIASIIANGTLGPRLEDGTCIYEVPTYAQQLNMAIWRAERAEALLLRVVQHSKASFRHALDCKLVSGELCSCGLLEMRTLFDELDKGEFGRSDNPVPPGFGRAEEESNKTGGSDA